MTLWEKKYKRKSQYAYLRLKRCFVCAKVVKIGRKFKFRVTVSVKG